MKKFSWLPKIIIPLVALTTGLVIGLSVSHIQIKKEQEVFQNKIKEANRRIAFMQKKMAEEKNRAAVSTEQNCQSDLDKLDNLRKEKKTLEGEVEKVKGQVQMLEMKIRESEEQVQTLEMKIKESDEASARTKTEIQEMERNNKDLGDKLKKIMEEKQTLQAELKKTTQDFGYCVADNAQLCIIADELVKKYGNKGLGAVLMEKEPLTQIKKAELEQFIRMYEEEIEQHKIKKNDAGGKNVTE